MRGDSVYVWRPRALSIDEPLIDGYCTRALNVYGIGLAARTQTG
jgi:hypothetical protein